VTRTSALDEVHRVYFNRYENDPRFHQRIDEHESNLRVLAAVQEGSPTQAFAGRFAYSLNEASAGFYPGVGEFEDYMALTDSTASRASRTLAAGSLLLSLLTLGESPNFSTARRSLSVDTHSLDDILTAQRYTLQFDVSVRSSALDTGVRSANPRQFTGRFSRVDPNDLRFSQTTAGGGGRASQLRESMRNGWNGPAIDVVETPQGLVTIDNTRVAVARELGISEIPVKVRLPSDPLPSSMLGRFGNAKTWGEAVQFRTGNQRPPLPASGIIDPPRLP
jgi:hypothetical protein